MSFAGEERDELYEGVPKKSCCRRALAAGLLLGAETAQGLSLRLVRDASGRGAAIAGILGQGERGE